MASLIRSLDAHKYLRATMTADSWQAGWRSLLLRGYVDPVSAEEFTTAPTADHLIVLVTAGACEIEGRYGGRWHKARYTAGSLGMTAPGDEVTVRWRGDVQHETLQLHLPAETVREAVAALAPGDPWQVAVPSHLLSTDPVIEAVMRGLGEALPACAPDIYAESAASFLAMHLLVRHGGFTVPGAPSRDRHGEARRRLYARQSRRAPFARANGAGG